ncbi:hypothetical protein Bca4012_007703 [Brassica carinata]
MREVAIGAHELHDLKMAATIEHFGEETTWTRDPVVENCDNLGAVVTAAKDVRKLVRAEETRTCGGGSRSKPQLEPKT